MESGCCSRGIQRVHSLAAWAEEFSDAFTGFLQEVEYSVVLTFGLYCYAHTQKGYSLNW